MSKRIVMIALALTLLFAGCHGKTENELSDVTPLPERSAAPSLSPQAEVPSVSDGVSPVTAGDCRVLFLNVGKADAALIMAGGQYWLVDTGAEDGAQELVQTLESLGVTALEGIFLTHTHADHTGGARRVAMEMPVSMFYRAAITTLTQKGKDRLTKLAGDAGVPETKLHAGDTLNLNGATLEILGPVSYNEDDDNDNSLVMKLTFNHHTVLFMGDAQFDEERTLAAADLTAEVLKVGNHGNPDATGDQFARAVNPQIAVISTDTLADADSANIRVRDALSMASIYVTECFTLGVQVDLSKEEITVSDPGFDPVSEALRNKDTCAILVNRAHLLAADYVPQGLVRIADFDIPALTLKSDDLMGDACAVDALCELMAAAMDADVSGFYLVSVYRTYAQQQALWDKKVAVNAQYGSDPSVAIVTTYPGASEHQTGLAFDISAVDARALSASFAQTGQGRWLYANAWRYGFILRYPENAQEETGIVFEPWHFRYVGKPLAAYLNRMDYTLERFYAQVGS